MDDFNLMKYKPKNPKESALIEYAYLKFGLAIGSEEFDNDYFSLFTVDDLIESMEFYIEKDGISAKITAMNYITYITAFFETLSIYGIKNEVFTDIALHDQLLEKSKEVASRLKDTESREVANDELYEKLNSGIEDYINNLDYKNLYDEIGEIKNGTKTNVRLYNRFISVISIKLIMQFALSNQTTINLEIESVDIKSRNFFVNGFTLHLNDELAKLLGIYLQIRSFILKLYDVQETRLFIKNNGKRYTETSVPDYGTFFLIMRDLIGTQSADLFAYRRILEMLNKGVSISTISKLTEKSISKLIELQETNNNQEDVVKKLQSFYQDSKEIDKRIIANKKGHLKCPFCNQERKATSDEWVLVQLKENGLKYLACGVCKGDSGRRISI